MMGDRTVDDRVPLAAIAAGELTADPDTGIVTYRGHTIGYARPDGYLRGAVARRPFLLHRLVWMCHHGPIPRHLEINHRNGRKWDNRLENLELVTKSGNLLHRNGKDYVVHRPDGVPVTDCDGCGLWQHLRASGLRPDRRIADVTGGPMRSSSVALARDARRLVF